MRRYISHSVTPINFWLPQHVYLMGLLTLKDYGHTLLIFWLFVNF